MEQPTQRSSSPPATRPASTAPSSSPHACARSLHDTSVTARVSIGADTDGAYRLAVALTAVLPGIPADQARELVDAAHQICPYSHATRNNLDVTITVA